MLNTGPRRGQERLLRADPAPPASRPNESGCSATAAAAVPGVGAGDRGGGHGWGAGDADGGGAGAGAAAAVRGVVLWVMVEGVGRGCICTLGVYMGKKSRRAWDACTVGKKEGTVELCADRDFGFALFCPVLSAPRALAVPTFAFTIGSYAKNVIHRYVRTRMQSRPLPPNPIFTPPSHGPLARFPPRARAPVAPAPAVAAAVVVVPRR